MATAFGSNLTDLARAMDAQTGRQNERALAVMQLLANADRTSATRYGSDRTLDAARLQASNEAERLNNALMLGREQLTSQEKIAQLGGNFSKEIAQLNFDGMKLPFSDKRMEHELAVARINASRLDPRMAGDAMAQNYDASKLNIAAKLAAIEANNLLKPALETAMSSRWFNKLTGPLTENEVAGVLQGIKSNPNLGLGKDQIFFNPKSRQFEAIEIPQTTFGVPGGAAPAPVGVPNPQALMQLDNPMMGVPQLPTAPAPPIPAQPAGSMAVPIAPRTVSAWDAPGAYPVQQSYGRIALQEPMAVPQFRPPPGIGQAQQLQQVGQLLAAQQFQRMAALRAQRLREAQAAAAASNAVPETVLPYLTQ